ncbi:MAG: RNA pyrophosphohydrolase [Gammaproteobacteria bacterium]|jgi:putative (di)nucleoside polyphosphate hydrolase
MIDEQGYRANVGIILTNDEGRLFWAKRIGADAWQFPQGGIRPSETTEKAMYRELREETGLRSEQVEVIGCTRDWLRYKLPDKYIRRRSRPLCIGQKQLWYLLRLLADESEVKLDTGRRPEFDLWRWVEFWEPLDEVIDFKRDVYEQALSEFAPLLFPGYRLLRSGRYS